MLLGLIWIPLLPFPLLQLGLILVPLLLKLPLAPLWLTPIVAAVAAPIVVAVGTVVDPTTSELEIAVASRFVERLGAAQQLQMQ